MARAALLLAAGGLAVPLLSVAPAEAATSSIAITAVALTPNPASATAGDTVTFRNADVVAHKISKVSGSWSFTAHTLSPGGTFSVRLPASSTAQQDVYRDSYSLAVVGAKSRTGTVQAAKTAAAPAPGPVAVPTAPTAPKPAPAPAPKSAAKPSGKTSKTGSTAAGSSSKAAAPSTTAGSSSTAATPSTGGTGSAALQPLTGGFLQQQQGGTALAQGPQIAGLLPGQMIPSGPVVDPLAPQVAGAPGDGRPTATTLAASRGALPSIESARRYGLPAVLALVLAAGVASLLVRLLLHEPAGRRVGGLA